MRDLGAAILFCLACGGLAAVVWLRSDRDPPPICIGHVIVLSGRCP